MKAEYRPDVEEWLPTEFSESIDLGRPLDQYYYVYELNDPKALKGCPQDAKAPEE